MPPVRLLIVGLLVAGCSSPDALDGWPAELVTRSPTSQSGLIGYSVNDLPAVQLLDSDGKPMVGVDITFAATAGGGSVSGAATTGSNGVATAAAWSVGLGANQVTATIPAPFRVPPVTFSATGVGQAYQIQVSYLTAVSPTRQAVFDSAAAHWARLIFGDVPNIDLSQNPIPPDLCFDGQPSIGGIIDDLLIHVILDSIDGPGFILGGAAPCFIRSTGKLPLHGVMIFDTADVANLESMGLFDEVILHEMGHVLGFGTIWGSSLLNLLVGPGGGDPFFSGPNARAAFDRMGGTSYTGGGKVPVENCCGPGTRDSHWREAVFDNELMTGFLDNGPNPLSVLTVASLRDEGYQVNYAAADAYSHPFTAALNVSAAPTGPTIALGDDVLRLPIYAVDGLGRLTLVARPRP
jgi:leishmanolysin